LISGLSGCTAGRAINILPNQAIANERFVDDLLFQKMKSDLIKKLKTNSEELITD
jgi:hypothetical protein